jgi:hypothetical protein
MPGMSLNLLSGQAKLKILMSAAIGYVPYSYLG